MNETPAQAIRVEIDHDRCQGVGMCLLTAPGVFAHDDRSQSVVQDSAAEPLERILVAAEACPTLAISVTEAASGATLFPPPDLRAPA